MISINAYLRSIQHTSLRNHDILKHIIAQTYSIHFRIPVCFQWPTDSKEQTNEDGREEHQAPDQGVHCHTDFPAVNNAQQEQSDADFGEHEGDERLNPIGPAECCKKAPL